jgi:hypothetical protein
MGSSPLKYVFEAVSVLFMADGNVRHGILSNTSEDVGIDRCQKFSKCYHEIFDSPGRNCINVLFERPQRKKSIGIRSDGGEKVHEIAPLYPIPYWVS